MKDAAMPRSSAPFKIGLLDAMGYGNLGDAAIQDSVIANIKKRLPNAQIIGFSFVPEDTVKRHGIPCYPISRPPGWGGAATQKADRNGIAMLLKWPIQRIPRLANLTRKFEFLSQSYKVLRDLDILIFSGGGQLGDLWGGPWGHPYNILKFAFLAKLAGKQVYFLNVGAETLEHWLSRFFVKSALRLADYVTFRDQESQTQMWNLGVKTNNPVHPDPAYALNVASYQDETESYGSRPIVGINPMGFCDPRVWPHKNPSAYERYLEKLTNFSLWLLAEGYDLKLFPTSPGIDKFAIADLEKRLAERFVPTPSHPQRAHSPGEGVRVVKCGSVDDILSEMSSCNYILTSKYHGVIFSHLLRKPVIAVGYHSKVDRAMRAAGQGRFSTRIEDFETDWLIRSFQSAVHSRDEIRNQQAGAVAEYARKLHQQFDKLFCQPIETPQPA